MKNKKRLFTPDTIIVLLCAAVVVFAVALGIARPQWLPWVLAVVVLAILAVIFAAGILHHRVRRAFGKNTGAKTAEGAIAASHLPVLVVDGESVVWYNDAFLHSILRGNENMLVPVGGILPTLRMQHALAPGGQDIPLGEERYTAYASAVGGTAGLYVLVFVEDTALKWHAEEYAASRPAVLYFLIDTYDEVLKELKESDRAQIMSSIDLALEKYIGENDGFLRRVTSSRYLAVVEERQLQHMIKNRFEILDKVRSAEDDAIPVTLSIGVGHNEDRLREADACAQQALDMALGRGGDQAAVKGPDGYEFFGGVARSVEKRTKVKSRIIAKAIQDLMGQYRRVLIMGHRNSDMDSIGAAVGMLRFAAICNKPAAVVVDRHNSQALPLLQYLDAQGYAASFITPGEAEDIAARDTLLVVVDTHIAHMLESTEVYEACGAVVVVDHHRKMVGHIDDAVIFYHAPYASSASELVSELLEYVGSSEDRLAACEAEALLAGIMLDTRTFSLHVGVRTFEAAAFLRRMGAQTEEVKKLFASTLDDYLYRSHLVAEAKIRHGCAVSLSDKVPAEYEVVAPKAANDLLTIEGVDASFVGIQVGNQIRISARSMGEVNVQLVMEKIGGGGHLTMAGAQLEGISLAEAAKILENALAEYTKERTHT